MNLIKSAKRWFSGHVNDEEEEDAKEEEAEMDAQTDQSSLPVKKKMLKRNVKANDDTANGLNNRPTPLDLATKADFRISNRHLAEYSINSKDKTLNVNFVKQHSKRRRKNYVMDLYETTDDLLVAIKEEMLKDGFLQMNHQRLAAEYPFFFWNGMFHCLGNVNILDGLMQKAGIQVETKRNRQKRIKL